VIRKASPPGWRQCTMGDLFKVKHGFAFDGKYFASEGEYVLLSPGNFHDAGGFKLKDREKYFTGDIPEDYVLSEGDLLVAMTEQAEGLLGSSALIPSSNRFLHNQRLGLITDWKATEIDLRFLYYLFNTREVRTQIRASATGTKVRHTSPTRIGEVRVAIPGVETQRKIATW
jgi:type I restriction enzyme S subunit